MANNKRFQFLVSGYIEVLAETAEEAQQRWSRPVTTMLPGRSHKWTEPRSSTLSRSVTLARKCKLRLRNWGIVNPPVLWYNDLMAITESEFIDNVMTHLLSINPDLGTHEKGLLSTDAGRMFRAGWDVQDAKNCLRQTEEVSPDIPEATALRRMHEIHAKYAVRPMDFI